MTAAPVPPQASAKGDAAPTTAAPSDVAAPVPVSGANGGGLGTAPGHAVSGKAEGLGGAQVSEQHGFDGEKQTLSHDELVAKVCWGLGAVGCSFLAFGHKRGAVRRSTQLGSC